MPNSPRIFLIGDVTTAENYIAFAKSKIRALRMLGLPFVQKSYLMDTGVMVRIFISNQGDRVYIHAASCPPVGVSGALDTCPSPSVHPYLVTRQLTQENRLQRDSAGELIQPTEFAYVWPITPPHTKSKTKKLPIAHTIESVDENGDLTYSIAASPYKEMFERFRPTRFTGHIRRSIQVMFGNNAWVALYPDTNGVVDLPIDFKFGNSWGLVRVSKTWHLVRITRSIVYDVPFEYCDLSIETSPDVFENVPVLQSADVHNGRAIYTLPSDVGTSWSNEIGWSFSYLGAEASIVLIKTAPYTGLLTTVHTVRFSHDQDDALTCAYESSATSTVWCALDSTGKLDNAWSVFNYVDDLGEFAGGLQNVTANFGSSDVPPRPPWTNYGVNNAALYVFYTPEKMVKCVYSYTTTIARTDVIAQASAVTGTTATGTTVPDYTPLYEQSSYGSTTHVAIAGFSVGIDTATAIVSDVSGQDKYEWGASTYIGSDHSDAAAAVANGSGEIVLSTPEGDQNVVGYEYTTAYGTSDVGSIERIHTQSSGGLVTSKGSLVMSVLDKECVLTYQHSDTTEKTETVSSAQWAWSRFNNGSPTGRFGGSASSDFPIWIDLGAKGLYGPCDKVYGRNYSETRSSASSSFVYALNGPATSILIDESVLGAPTVYTNATCGYSYTANNYGVGSYPLPPGSVNVRVYPATSSGKLQIVGHGKIDLDITQVDAATIPEIHPKESILKYCVTQAAIDAGRHIRPKTHVNSAPAIRFALLADTWYDVENPLYGWVGAA